MSGAINSSPREIKRITKDTVINLVLETVAKNKQVLIFNNSKRNSESVAEKTAKEFEKKRIYQSVLEELSEKILKNLSHPTAQCKKLAYCVKFGVAFHHSGLTTKQRNLVEKAFKSGDLKVISSTPTLAAGLNLPAYKVIIKDYKRYSHRGFADIPVLEFHQMAGRAGRPGIETLGKSVVHVKSSEELDRVVKKYIHGKPEEIYSKLAVEPTLKMYLLSLLSMDMINTTEEIKLFFSNTFYAYQFQDMESLYFNIMRVLDTLKDYGFVHQEDDFYRATPIGKKISELYLNPDTAHYFLKNFNVIVDHISKKINSKEALYAFVFYIGNSLEMKPLFRVNSSEEELFTRRVEEVSESLIEEFNPFENDYATFLSLLKTTDIFIDWIGEAPEDYLSDKYKITPGELHYKLEIVDWLLYCFEEFALMKKEYFFRTYVNKLRLRFKTGVREDILSLIVFKGIGRVRARTLAKAGLRKVGDLRKASFEELSRIVGSGVAGKLKEQLTEVEEEIESDLRSKPKELTVREVTDKEIDILLENINKFEKEKEERNKSLHEFI